MTSPSNDASDRTELVGPDRTFWDMWEIFFRPEIERRQIAGLIDETFELQMAQVLFPIHGESIILLNREVQGVGLMRIPRPISKGEGIYSDDLQYLERYELPENLLDNGHFTIIRAGESWRMFFNFLSGRAKARDMLVLAGQFLESSRVSAERQHAGPAIDTLFSAAELISKAELILHRSKAAEAKTHSVVASEINAWAKLGNIDSAFVALFNKLAQQRPNARYGNRKNSPPIPDQDAFDLVGAMIERGLFRTRMATEDEKEDRRSTDDGRKQDQED